MYKVLVNGCNFYKVEKMDIGIILLQVDKSTGFSGHCKAQFEVIKQEKRFSDSTLPTCRAIFHSSQR